MTFSKQNDIYIYQFTLNGVSNIHIEKLPGDIKIYRTCVSGNAYAPLENIKLDPNAPVLDFTLKADLYPLYIKIVSRVNPTKSEIVGNKNTPVDVKVTNTPVDVKVTT